MKKAAVIGFGTVGSGVCELLERHAKELAEKAGEQVSLGYICDLRDFPDSPYGNKHIKDFDIVCRDPDVSVVIELTGARRAAYEMTKKALMCGKSVVTSNKEVVAEFGTELLKIAKDNGVSYLFEAAVGGAIPILRPLRDSLATDRITCIYGILNGTTNYILTRMSGEGDSYEDALQQARQLGYAEPDPSADVLGKDTCRKTSVLCACMTGRLIPPSDIPTKGITDITPRDLKFASALGGVIKLIGSSEKTTDGITAFTEPCFIPYNNPLSGVNDVNNGILVRCEASGDLMFYGRGAGSIPTAAAVLSDIAEAVSMPGGSGLWTAGKCDGVDSGKYGEFLLCRGFLQDINAVTFTDGDYTAVLLPAYDADEKEAFKQRIIGCGAEIISSYRALE